MNNKNKINLSKRKALALGMLDNDVVYDKLDKELTSFGASLIYENLQEDDLELQLDIIESYFIDSQFNKYIALVKLFDLPVNCFECQDNNYFIRCEDCEGRIF